MSRSKEERLRYLLRVVKAILAQADSSIRGDTEYLRDEFERLQEDTDVLLGKMDFEEALVALRNKLHVSTPEDDRERDPVFSPETTGVRAKL